MTYREIYQSKLKISNRCVINDVARFVYFCMYNVKYSMIFLQIAICVISFELLCLGNGK